jgi:hypothetical protein
MAIPASSIAAITILPAAILGSRQAGTVVADEARAARTPVILKARAAEGLAVPALTGAMNAAAAANGPYQAYS